MGDRGDRFSIVGGGPTYGLMRRFNLVRHSPGDVGRLSFAAILLVWVPLVLLAFLVDATAEGDPILRNVAVHVRLLFTLPCLFAAEASMHRLTARCLTRFVEGNWAAEQGGEVDRIIGGLRRLRDSSAAEGILLLLAAAASFSVSWRSLHPEVTGARADWTGAPPLAVLWYAGVSLLVFNYVALRWLWRWLLWCGLLFRLSRLRVRPIATHPDERGGLGFLSEPSVGFAPVVLGLSAMLAADRSTALLANTRDLPSVVSQGVLFAIGAVLLAFAPLVFFAPHLWRARHEALRTYGNLANDYVRAFDARWIGGKNRQALLGSPDIQSLADLDSAFGVLRRMRLVPVTRRQVLLIVAAVALPLSLVVFTQIPLADLIGDLTETWLGKLPP